MKVALAQMNIKWEDKAQNMLKAEKMTELAKENNADLIIFPEMTLTGFSFNTKALGEDLKESMSIKFFKSLSIKNNINICFGMIAKEEEKYFNKCIVINKKGEIIANYSKIHPFSFSGEDKYFNKGNDKIIYSLNEFNISPFICYDLRFPEVFRKDCEKAEVITVIASWPESRKEHWLSLLRARAIENQSYVIGVNRVGIGDNLNYSGNSVIYNYNGDKILDCEDKEGVYFCSIEKAVLKKYRDGFPVLKDKHFI